MSPTQNRHQLISQLFEDLSLLGRSMWHRTFRGDAKSFQWRSQIGFLYALTHTGAQSVKELAAHFHMTSSAATQIIDELVHDRLVVRTENATDRRKLEIAITQKGEDRLAQIKKKRFARLAELLASLTDEELASLYRIEQKIVTRMQELSAESDAC